MTPAGVPTVIIVDDDALDREPDGEIPTGDRHGAKEQHDHNCSRDAFPIWRRINDQRRERATESDHA